MLDMEVKGCAISVSTLKKRLMLCNYSHRYFKISALDNEESVEPNRPPVKKKRKIYSVRAQAKEKQLQEILSIKTPVKKKKTVVKEKLPLPVSNYVYPTYQILTDLYKSQKKTLEEMKLTLVIPFSYEKDQHSLFDMTVLLPYMSNAYHNLYNKHIDNLKELIKSTSHFDKEGEEDLERKVLQIKGIMQSENNSLESECDYESKFKE